MTKKKEEQEQEEQIPEVKSDSNNVDEAMEILKIIEEKDQTIKAHEEKIKEFTDMLQRLQAEFINYKNRVEKENRLLIEYSNAELVKKLLPVIDSFEMALKNTQDHEKFIKGMEMIHGQLMDALKHEGLNEITTKDKKFDPYKHEVLMKGKSDKPEDTIIDEFQKGYMFKERVIRHSKVKLSG